MGRYLLAVVSYIDAKQNVDPAMSWTGPGWSRPIRWQWTQGTERRCSATRIRTPLARRTSPRPERWRRTPRPRAMWVARSLPKDPDPNDDTLTYTLSGDDAGLFSVGEPRTDQSEVHDETGLRGRQDHLHGDAHGHGLLPAILPPST